MSTLQQRRLIQFPAMPPALPSTLPLSPCAAKELIYRPDEISTMQQRRLIQFPPLPFPLPCPPPSHCSPCAAEELIYGPDEMSTMQQRRLIDARRIVQKLVVSAAMTENAAIGPRTISVPRK